MAMEQGGHETDEVRSKVCEKDLEENISKGKNSEQLFEDEGNIDKSIVINTEDDMGSTRSVDAEEQQARICTRKGVQVNLENARKKTKKAGMAVESRINRIDELLREQCSDIVKLTASKDGLQMDMDDFKRFNEKLSDLLLLSLSDYNSNIEDQVYFERIREKYLECCADVKTRIGDLTQERLEMLSQKASNSVTSRMSRLSRASYVSSKQAAANAAALKEKMLSLKRKQIIERQQEELKHQQEELKHHQRELEHHQRELEWQVEQEQLQGEINAAEVLHQTLLGDTMLLSSNTQPTSNTLHENTTEVSQLPTITKDMNTGTSSDMTTPSNPITPLNPTTPPSPTTPLNPITPPNPTTPSTPTTPSSPTTTLDSTKPAFTPVNAYTQPVNHLHPTTTSPLEQMQRETFEIQRQQVELMKKMCLPTPPVFSGNILAYPKWMLAFDALIDDEAVNPAHKLYYLGEYTSGQAQKMIDGLLGLQSDDAYKRARQILQERFGDPYKIYQAYNERLKSWPVCSKASELQEFSDFLVTVQETMKTVKHLKDFDTFSAIQDLVVRLPPYGYTVRKRLSLVKESMILTT